MENKEEPINIEGNLKDPDPISIALALLGPLVGAGSLIVQQVSQRARERRENRATVRKHLHMIDRALNRLDEAYRSLISIYNQFEVLNIPFIPGKNPLYADEKVTGELNRLLSNIFYGGRDLQDALSELVGLVSESDVAVELSDALEVIFRKALHSEQLFEFLIHLGILMKYISEFLHQVGEDYGFRPSSNHTRLIQSTLDDLESRF
jgi:hypothetical protein